MREAFLHYVWQFRLFETADLRTTAGEKVEIINVGKPNSDAGPDFFNAQVRIGDTLWAGNVEIHLRSSDWKRHGHAADYDSVVLHAVGTADEAVFRSSGEEIPQIVLCYSPEIEAHYEAWLQNPKPVACADEWANVSPVVVCSYLNRLLTERLEQKTETIERLLEQSKNHWEEAFYVTLARNFGFGINADPFEQLARSLPLNYLAKHKDNLFQVEALLFGQSGLFNAETSDEYELSLQKEYRFLQAKFGLKSLENPTWKLLRLRPSNFPHLRIAQLASLIHRSSKLFSKIIENPTYEALKTLFDTDVSDYWHTHFRFGHSSPCRSQKMGKGTVDILLINTVAPFLFTYGKQRADEQLTEKALALLEKIPAERNTIIQTWKELNINASTAFETQALLQLRRRYCDEKRCLACAIGYKLLVQRDKIR